MTKKQKVLELFNSTDWYESPSGELAMSLSKDDFESVGLCGEIENARQHCDLIYARKIIQELGHKVLIGGAFHIWKDKLNNSN